ncbi:MAG: hypothetical protein IIT60_04060 [Muribaculaceae bacterium]|nr:hypothetical protein [Muribaculaceae bacterium]MBQ5466406.1 hypothetical protein [Muribaculaceae bacterium]
MDTIEFNKTKQEVLSRPIVYRELEAHEIVALGENQYAVGDANFVVNPRVACEIDRFAGIKKGQSRIAHDSYGVPGLTNLRNFFGQATASAKRSKRIVLAANTQARQIVDAIPIRGRIITPEVFFDFAEMFMDKNSYVPHNVEYSQFGGRGISILMKPVEEQFMEYEPDDEFLSNGIFLLWTPGEISLGNYYERLVCTNGSTQMSRHTITKAFSPEAAHLEQLLDVNSESAPFKENLNRMLVSARLAMRTPASVHEMKVAMKMLCHHGMAEEDANQVIPYSRLKTQYEEAGYYLNSVQEGQAKTNRSMWDVFNLLTYFATHNTVWAQQDIRRSSLMEASMNLLLRERDIKDYYNIF